MILIYEFLFLGKGFFQRIELKVHISKMHESGHKRYRCDYEGCGESFDKMGEMNKHQKNDHAGDTKKYQCDQCEKSYNKEPTLQIHIDRIHNGNKPICPICGRQLSRQESLKGHLKVHEKEAEKQKVEWVPHTIEFYPDSEYEDLSNDPKHPSKSWSYYLYNAKTDSVKCRFCGLDRPQKKGDMVGHLKRIHKVFVETKQRSNDPERFKCEYCGKIFKDINHLRDHRNTHTGERPHVCKYCGKTFASKGNKYAHQRQAHQGKPRNYSNRKSMVKSEI